MTLSSSYGTKYEHSPCRLQDGVCLYISTGSSVVLVPVPGASQTIAYFVRDFAAFSTIERIEVCVKRRSTVDEDEMDVAIEI